MLAIYDAAFDGVISDTHVCLLSRKQQWWKCPGLRDIDKPTRFTKQAYEQMYQHVYGPNATEGNGALTFVSVKVSASMMALLFLVVAVILLF
jgi:hypothetical protein